MDAEPIFETPRAGVVVEAHPLWGVAVTSKGGARQARRWASKYARRFGKTLARRNKRPMNSMFGGYVYSFDYAESEVTP